MAERIVSPGVFTREKDLSFLPAGIAQLGAAIIGPTKTGPAMVPTQISSFSEFNEKFGGEDINDYTGYTAKSYLQRGGAPGATIVRVLGNGGYSFDSAIILTLSGSNITSQSAAVLLPTVSCSSLSNISNGSEIGFGFQQSKINDTLITAVRAAGKITFETVLVGNNGSTLTLADSNGNSVTYKLVLTTEAPNTAIGQFGVLAATLPSNALIVASLKAAIEYKQPNKFILNTDASGLQVTHSAYGTAGNNRTFSDTIDTSTIVVPTGGVDGVSGASDFVLTMSGSNISASVGLSLDPSNEKYITKVLGTSANGSKYPLYVHSHFSEYLSSSFAAGSGEAVIASTVDYVVSGSVYGAYGFTEAETPYIIDQSSNSLFKFRTINDGSDVNRKFKLSISNIKPSGSVAGSEYGSFTVEVRKFDDLDIRSTAIESFDNCNLDETSVNYVARKIGDKYLRFEDTGKIQTYGNYSTKSKYIFIEMSSNSFNKTQIPFGFGGLGKPVNSNIPNPSYVSNLSGSDGRQNVKLYFGLNFSNSDNLQYTNTSVVTSTTSTDYASNTSTFLLSSCKNSNGTTIAASTITSTPIKERKFTVPFYGGFDGMSSYVKKLSGTEIATGNVFGFDCSSATSKGTVSYRAAIDTVRNPDEIDINMLITPGIIKSLHSSVSSYAITMCEDRGDVFYLLDTSEASDNITTAVSNVLDIDSNFVATYYPWVRIVDGNLNRPLWVSPSVVMAGAIAFNDKIGAEWFAPAGLNRGGLTEVTEAYTRLTHEERDELYEGRVNPIATFPGQGVVAFGQKTLQGKPSALDRINVRRLLINLKKFIASSSRFLVFEQNTAATRTRFLNMVNPYLESVQSRSGLSAFKVVMDGSNNTSEVIDRNQLVGQIYIQPTRTAEFIVLDFVVLPTGASFPA